MVWVTQAYGCACRHLWQITAEGTREVGLRTISLATQENLLIVDSISRGSFQFQRFLRALEKRRRATRVPSKGVDKDTATNKEWVNSLLRFRSVSSSSSKYVLQLNTEIITKYFLFTIWPTIAHLYQTQSLRITCAYMFRHLKCHPQGAHCALLKLHTDLLVLVK